MEKVKFRNLSFFLKIGIIGGVVYVIFFLINFILGFLYPTAV